MKCSQITISIRKETHKILLAYKARIQKGNPLKVTNDYAIYKLLQKENPIKFGPAADNLFYNEFKKQFKITEPQFIKCKKEGL